MALSFIAPTVRASTGTFSQLQAGGLAGHVDRLIAAQTALANPTTQATASATGGGSTGGFFAAGTHYISYTFVNGFGETTAGTSESAQLTVSAGNIPRITLPSLPTGATSINLYATAASGATGSEVLYAQGITTTTYDMAIASPVSTVTPPTANTTAISQAQANLLKRFRGAGVQAVMREYATKLDNWLRGDPITEAQAQAQVALYAGVFSMLRTLANEVGVLVHANPGTLANTTSGNTRRTFP
jgi:hypothetical protein